jgi:hypothetical protein
MGHPGFAPVLEKAKADPCGMTNKRTATTTAKAKCGDSSLLRMTVVLR